MGNHFRIVLFKYWNAKICDIINCVKRYLDIILILNCWNKAYWVQKELTVKITICWENLLNKIYLTVRVFNEAVPIRGHCCLGERCGHGPLFFNLFSPQNGMIAEVVSGLGWQNNKIFKFCIICDCLHNY